MRRDFKISILLAVAAIPVGVALMVAPLYFDISKDYLGWFFWGGLTSAAALILAAIIIAARDEESAKSNRISRPIVVMAVLSIGFFGWAAWYFWPETVHQQPDQQVSAPLLAEQVQELKDIDNFVGSADEGSIRTIFDLPRMASMNILLADDWAIRNAPEKQYSLSKAQTKAMNDFAKSALITFDSRLATISPPPPGSIVRKVELSADYFCCLYLSPGYLAALQRLRRYEASATLPNDVKVALTRFDATIASDVALIPTAINEYYGENHELLIHDGDQKSLYFGQVTAGYWNHLAPLRPRAADISSTIRKYLKVE